MKIEDWATKAAREILFGLGRDCTADVVDLTAAVISSHCPMKPDVAYMPVPRCDGCAHWSKHHGYSVCNFAIDGDAKMFAAGMDDVRIITHADFGCTQWKEKA